MTPFLDDAIEVVPLAGGTHHTAWIATQADGARYVVKATPGVPPDMFDAEAEGLIALRRSGVIGAPRVVAVGPGHLVMEALNPVPGFADTVFWERTGRALARLHLIRGSRFGWSRDNWLGPTRQVNTWTLDCYEFYARYRILRYLREPRMEAMLDASQRAAIERICARLPDLVPPSYPALTHGDLWHGNVVSMADGSPALIDPAISWNWPEADLSMMYGIAGMVPGGASPGLDRFFAAYQEIRPLHPGWREHLELLHLRELLCVLFQTGRGWARPRVLTLIQRYG
ncbi:fructosamine kinase family protein [Actinomadura sp. HBU206391]|uniref:fructosamine kinase family protein n=1 Tax=Actinomadura sp. HBU206391 TaxID=2731692 RepID=UPI00164FED92|nr:fructosamine kinase family protein [Actinomadura sp. HBU206391]MBC6460816.1 fructosamine kinase family protein [Actinomadura sp. HBU206391]